MLTFNAAVFTPEAYSQEQTIRGFKNFIEFSDLERAEHLPGIPAITRAAGACIQGYLNEQNDFWEMWKLSIFYGHESDWNRKWTQQQKDALFNRMHVPLSEMKKLKPVSCVTMTLSCLEIGFKAARQEHLWERIRKFTLANDQSGIALQLGLQKLGWKVLYWNPDTSKAKEWDDEERARDQKIRQGNEPENQFRFFGWHQDRLRTVRKSMTYYFNPVDDATSLTDYGPSVPAKFLKVPFFVGTVHTGFHVFPGKFGFVIEAHNRSRPTNKRTIEAGNFDPSHPREPHPNAGAYGTYRSGLIAVPPGYGY